MERAGIEPATFGLQSLTHRRPRVEPLDSEALVTLSHEDVFKNDPGIGKFGLNSAGDPVADTTIEIWLGKTNVATVQTDADGRYMWSYK